jgi:hypothetical protein
VQVDVPGIVQARQPGAEIPPAEVRRRRKVLLVEAARVHFLEHAQDGEVIVVHARIGVQGLPATGGVQIGHLGPLHGQKWDGVELCPGRHAPGAHDEAQQPYARPPVEIACVAHD